MPAIIGVLAIAVVVLAVLLFKEKKDGSGGKDDAVVKTVTKAILNKGGVGPVLAVTNEDNVLFYNSDFVRVFPEIVGTESIKAYPEMVRIFKDEEYVSESLSKIYEVRHETIEEEKVSGRFVWLVDITDHYKTNKKLSELKDMAEAGLCGTAAVISPVGKIVDHGNEICFPAGMEEMGPITKKLYDTLTGIQMGRIKAPEGWVREIC